ncbi:MAG: RNA methyltransferase [Acidobacteria bacterium]|nr:RNA methyltransferase [Acidobacteriota bacterium]
MHTVRSRRNELVTRFRNAAHARRPDRTTLLLDGVRLIRDACAAGAPIATAILSQAALADGDSDVERLARDLEAGRVPVAAGSAAVMAAVSPVRTPSAAVALGDHRPASLDAVLKAPRDVAACVVAPVGVQDPGNLGAIIRTAEAAGAAGVAVAGRSADPYGWKALRGAMGSTFRVPVADGGSPTELVAAARSGGFRVLAAVPRGGQPLQEADLGRRHLVLVGGEGAGLSPFADLADDAVSVPMEAAVESLNVAVAAGVILYEARRQRASR